MPSRTWQNRIQDILGAVTEIEHFVEGMTFEDFQADAKTVRAMLYDMADMRNIAIHEYFQVNLAIVWQTIQEDLIPLAISLRQLLD